MRARYKKSVARARPVFQLKNHREHTKREHLHEKAMNTKLRVRDAVS